MLLVDSKLVRVRAICNDSWSSVMKSDDSLKHIIVAKIQIKYQKMSTTISYNLYYAYSYIYTCIAIRKRN